MQALEFVGMSEFAAQRAGTLSGGQQQRGAVARAIVQRARVILADEPIASLDPESARLVMQKLRDMNRREGVTVVVSVHQVEYAVNYCDTVVAMKDGRVLDVCDADRLDLDKLKTIYGQSFEAMHARFLSPAPVDQYQKSHDEQLSKIDVEARLDA
jgi:phosphonate transport system ATP-binding protein